MEDLKTLLLDEKSSIASINERVNKYIGSEKDYSDYSNKLKLTFVALNLFKKSSELLHSVKQDDFISQVTEKINEMEKEKETLSKEYDIYLKQNDKVYNVLSDKNNDRIPEIQDGIRRLLNEYDGILNDLVKLRDGSSLPERYNRS